MSMETPEEIEYRMSTVARYLRLTIRSDGRVVVTIPRRGNRTQAERFVASKLSWIRAQRARLLQRVAGRVVLPAIPVADRPRVRRDAERIVRQHLAEVNQIYGCTVGRISIRNQRTRWGSCSRRKNLSFNMHIVSLPEPLARYLVVHELCHILEMSHSARFWAQVERAVPNYRVLRQQLRQIHLH